MTVCRVFLLLNGHDLQIETESIDEGAMNIAIDVANSGLDRGDLTGWISERMYPLDVM